MLRTTVYRAARGDEHALSALYEQYSGPMFGICLRMTGSAQDAEDILQESFITAFKKISQLKDAENFGGWLKKIVIRKCIRFLRRSENLKELDKEYADTEEEKPDWLKNLNVSVIMEEISKLPAGCRAVFNLYAMEDYPHKEIAKLLGISESTSKSQYARARQLLKKNLLKYLSQHG